MKKTVLIVDDEPEIGIMLADVMHDVAVHQVYTGNEALIYVEENKADIVFLDLQLPHVNGMEILKQIRARELHSIVIMITAFATVETAVEAMKIGADDFLCKPVSLHDLQQKVTQFMGDIPPAKAEITSLEEVEKRHIASILQRNRGNRRQTANDLDISLRTLYYKIKQYDLE